MALIPTDNNLVDASSRVKSYDKGTGIQSVKGGQTVRSGVIDSITASYSTLVYHPIALTLLIFGVFILLAEYHNKHGPLELIFSTLLQMDEKKPEGFPSFIISTLLVIVGYMIKFKIFVGKAALLAFTYICKPSSRNLVYSIILSLFAFVSGMDFVELFLLSQLFFLFVMLRNPAYKTIVVVLFISIFVTGYINVQQYLPAANTRYSTSRSPQSPTPARTSAYMPPGSQIPAYASPSPQPPAYTPAVAPAAPAFIPQPPAAPPATQTRAAPPAVPSSAPPRPKRDSDEVVLSREDYDKLLSQTVSTTTAVPPVASVAKPDKSLLDAKSTTTPKPPATSASSTPTKDKKPIPSKFDRP